MARPIFRAARPPIVDPPWARWLFNQAGAAWVWAVVRTYLGWLWIEAGWHKIADPAWVRSGATLQGFWRAATAPVDGGQQVAYDWYREFIRTLLEGGHHTWFAPLVAYGELIVGICLVVGLFTGFAAFLGAFANFNFMLAGSASTNPVLFALAVLLVLAWKVAGYIGLDYWVLPVVGTPWRANPAAGRGE